MKNSIFREEGGGRGGFMKNQYVGGDCLQRGTWTAKEGARWEKRGGALEEEDESWYPNAHYGDTSKK